MRDIRTVFDERDTDGSGRLSMSEMSAAMKALKVSLTQEEVEMIFKAGKACCAVRAPSNRSKIPRFVHEILCLEGVRAAQLDKLCRSKVQQRALKPLLCKPFCCIRTTQSIQTLPGSHQPLSFREFSLKPQQATLSQASLRKAKHF